MLFVPLFPFLSLFDIPLFVVNTSLSFESFGTVLTPPQLDTETTAFNTDHREQIDLSTPHPVPGPDKPLYHNLLAPNQWPSPEYLPSSSLTLPINQTTKNSNNKTNIKPNQTKTKFTQKLTLFHPKKLFAFFISIPSFSRSGNPSKNPRPSLTTSSINSAGKPVSLRYKNPTFRSAERREVRKWGFVLGSRAWERGRMGIVEKDEEEGGVAMAFRGLRWGVDGLLGWTVTSA